MFPAALAEQREAAGTDQAALVWSLTVSAVTRAILGHLTQSRADLAEVRQITLYAAPLLAQPFWRFTEVLCDWLGGKWVSAQSGAEALETGQLSPVNPVMAGIILAVRTELLRGLGQSRESRLLAQRLSFNIAAGPDVAEIRDPQGNLLARGKGRFVVVTHAHFTEAQPTQTNS